MISPDLLSVRLTAFKSFRGAVLPIHPVTVLTGRNNSGKSNALDVIEVLSRLATGEEAATGTLNESILVCYRDEAGGASKIAPLTELPGYAEAMASGRIGDAISMDQLTRPAETGTDFAEFHRALGIT